MNLCHSYAMTRQPSVHDSQAMLLHYWSQFNKIYTRSVFSQTVLEVKVTFVMLQAITSFLWWVVRQIRYYVIDSLVYRT